MTINDKKYPEPVLNYAAVRRLAHVGVDLFKADADPFSMLDGYVFLATNSRTLEQAQQTLSDHIENGGDIDAIAEAMGALIEKSSFFQKLKEKQEKAAEAPKA